MKDTKTKTHFHKKPSRKIPPSGITGQGGIVMKRISVILALFCLAFNAPAKNIAELAGNLQVVDWGVKERKKIRDLAVSAPFPPPLILAPSRSLAKSAATPEVALIIGCGESWVKYKIAATREFLNSAGISDAQIFCYVGDGNTEVPEGLKNYGPANRKNIENFVADHLSAERLNVFVFCHGGGYQKRIDLKINYPPTNDGGACVSTPIQLTPNVPNFDYEFNETNIELGILYFSFGENVEKINDCQIRLIYDEDDQGRMSNLGIRVKKFIAGQPFINSRGEKISLIEKAIYYLVGSDSNGVIAPGYQVDISALGKYFIDPENSIRQNFLRLVHKEVFIWSDLDCNGILDIPIAVFSGSDTLLGTCLNQGKNFNPLNLHADGLDADGDGFIMGCDFNDDGVIDPNTKISIQEVIVLNQDSLLYDFEWQTIFSQYRGIQIHHFHQCQGGGFADNPPSNKSICWSLSPADNYGLGGDLYYLQKMSNKIHDGETDYLTLFNLARADTSNPYASLLSLNDNGDKIVSFGPWPNNNSGNGLDGLLSSQIFLSPSRTLATKDQINNINFSLAQNFPNPFNNSTVISFVLPKTSEISLDVYNSLGQKVAELANGQFRAGEYRFAFAADNLSSGIYFCLLKTPQFWARKKMLLVR